MDALSGLGQGFLVALSFDKLLYCSLGVLLGTAVGCCCPALAPELTVACSCQ